jgi:hypothetical protein
MPGWVLTSSRNSPSSPCSSSQRKSERLQPLQPSSRCAERVFHHSRGDVLGDLGRADVLGHPVGVLGVEIVEARLRLELGHAQRLVAEHRRRQLAPADEGLGQQALEFLPRPLGLAADRIAVIALVGDDGDADREPSLTGLST